MTRGARLETLDKKTIRKAQQGNHEAFSRIFHKYKSSTYRLCFRFIHNHAIAEDLTQEAFLQLYRKIGTFQFRSAFTTWFYSLTVNVALMELRRRKLPTVSLEMTNQATGEQFQDEIADCDGGFNACIARKELGELVADLAPGYRTAFVLKEIGGYEHKDIAEATGRKIGNSKSQLSKAKMRLRERAAELERLCRQRKLIREVRAANPLIH
ncbi:MAG TPA: RNA polymerase sigma factor [Candidatus Paceibacterota bacterium]|nr:RNA polymerase sigma factor [Candidatus Paceibacterota bacterium]